MKGKTALFLFGLGLALLRSPPPASTCLYPLGLRYRRLVPASRGYFCLACPTAPGFRPGGRPTFLYRQESRQRSDPASSALALRGLPCAARSLRVGQNSLRELRSLRSDNRPKSVVDARCARPAKPCAAQLVRRGRPTPAGLAARGLIARADAQRGVTRSRRRAFSWASW